MLRAPAICMDEILKNSILTESIEKYEEKGYTILGYDRNFVIMDSDDSLTVVKKILKDMNYDPKIYNPKAIRNKISSCKNEMMSPEAYEKYAVSDYEKVIQQVYAKYEEELNLIRS